VKAWLVAAMVGTAAPALAGAGRAGPLADALSRHGEADIAALRAQRSSADARCTLGAIYAKLGDLPRAALFLDGCDAAKLAPDIADAVARADADVQRALRASQLSSISIDSDPPGLAVETDALPGEAITTPATVWARAGTYYVKGNTQTTTMLHLERHTRASVVLDNHPHTAQHAPRTHTVDFLDEPTDPANTTPPPAQKHPSLLPCKYTGCDTHSGETLDDPFALHTDRVPGLPDFALGARVGTSAAFHDGASRIAPAFAIDGRMRAGRFPGLGPAVVDVRLDWAPRGGGEDGNFQAFGASAQYGIVLFAPRAAWLTWFGGIRGELRTNTLATMPGPRTALGYTTALELALRSLPITIGVRYDQDREQALIVEIGCELRDGLQ
jgi:hypothetical protein